MFKACPTCKTEWLEFVAFLADHELVFTGYQANPANPPNGVFLFTHRHDGCNTTLAIQVNAFRIKMMHGRELKPFTPDDEGCEHHCLDVKNLMVCGNQKCHGSVIRQLIQEIKKAMGSAV